jgi:hypothetical protein
MMPVTPADRARQALNLTLAVGQIAATFVPPLTGYGRPIGDGAAGVAVNPAAPPGPAFAIWGLLFPAVVAYAVYQAAPRRAADPLLRATGWLTAAALALTVAWVSVSQLVGIPAAADAGFSGVILACYLTALAWVGRGPRLWWFVAVPVALMAGWLTVAFGVNLAAALVATGTLPGAAVAGEVVALAGAAGVLVPWLLGGGGWYAGPVAWGLGWVAVGNLGAGGSAAVAGIAAAAGLLVVAAVLPFRRPPRPDDERHVECTPLRNEPPAGSRGCGHAV